MLRRVLASLVLLLVLPASAAAKVTTAAIGEPAGDAALAVDLRGDPGATVHVAGAAPGAADGDRVDVLCSYVNPDGNVDWLPVAEGVAVAGEAFSADASPLRFPAHACLLEAVPQWAPPTRASEGTRLVRLAVHDADPLRDTWIGDDEAFELTAPGACGVRARTFAARVDVPLLRCGGRLEASDGEDATRSELRVDGFDAYTAEMVTGGHRTPGVPAITSTWSTDPATGAVTQTQVSDVLRCADGAYHENPAACPSLVATGVRFRRVTTSAQGGRQLWARDRYESADGLPHAVDVLGEVELDGDTLGGLRFPWHDAAWEPLSDGDRRFAGPGGEVASWFARDGAGRAAVAVTTSPAPEAIDFWATAPTVPESIVQQAHTGPVPLEVTTVFSYGRTVAGVEALASAAEAALDPPPAGAGGGGGAPGDGDGDGDGGKDTGAPPAQPPADPPAEQQQPPAAAPVAPATGTSKAPRPAPRRCVVPRLSGLTVTGARRALSRARCTLGKVTRSRSRKGRRGRVLRQGAKPGARLKAGARVTVTVRR